MILSFIYIGHEPGVSFMSRHNTIHTSDHLCSICYAGRRFLAASSRSRRLDTAAPPGRRRVPTSPSGARHDDIGKFREIAEVRSVGERHSDVAPSAGARARRREAFSLPRHVMPPQPRGAFAAVCLYEMPDDAMAYIAGPREATRCRSRRGREGFAERRPVGPIDAELSPRVMSDFIISRGHISRVAAAFSAYLSMPGEALARRFGSALILRSVTQARCRRSAAMLGDGATAFRRACWGRMALVCNIVSRQAASSFDAQLIARPSAILRLRLMPQAAVLN